MLLDIDKAIEINPKGDYFSTRGLMKIDLKDKDSACMDFSRSGELGESNAYDYIKQYCN